MSISELVQVPASDLIIDKNVRRTVDVDKSFISSIRNHGILQPPVGWKDDAGKIHITMGQRRTIAAQKIGLETVPVVLMTQTDAEQARIVAQLAENEQRSSLTAADTAAAYAQLQFEFGVTPEQIARKTNSPKVKVDTALAVSSSTAATAALESAPITLEQAAIFTEFEDDTEALDALNAVVGDNPAMLEHTASKLREDRLDREVIERLEAIAVDLGATVVDGWHEWEKARAADINHLWREGDDERTRIKPDDLRSFTDVYAWVRSGYRGDDDRGFRLTFGIAKPRTQGLDGNNLGHAGAAGGLSDVEKEARRQKRQDKADMVAATIVRRAWIRDTLLVPATSRPAKLEASMLRWIVAELFHTAGTLRPSTGMDLELILGDLLGAADPDEHVGHAYHPVTGDYISGYRVLADSLSKDRDPLRIAIAAAIGQTEAVVGNPKADGFGQDLRAGRYLAQLEEWGYTLAEVEQRIVAAYNEKVAKAAAKDAAK